MKKRPPQHLTIHNPGLPFLMPNLDQKKTPQALSTFGAKQNSETRFYGGEFFPAKKSFKRKTKVF
jgi:hypothetical protein